MKYIDADKLIKFKEALADIIVSSQGICTYQDCKDIAERESLLLIATLQEEQPEVDLEKIIEQTYHDGSVADTSNIEPEDYKYIARHFYELGKARKEESVSIAESPSKTFPRVNEFDCGSSYRH